eukprot:5606940-Amphidinium_carterae.1
MSWPRLLGGQSASPRTAKLAFQIPSRFAQQLHWSLSRLTFERMEKWWISLFNCPTSCDRPVP